MSIEYKKILNIDKFKKDASEVLGGYGKVLTNHKEIRMNNKLIGYVGFEEHTGTKNDNFHKALGIGDFMILDRGKGYGTKVMKDIIEKYKDTHDLIYCFVDANNKGAIRFYKRLGTVYDDGKPNKDNKYYVVLYKESNIDNFVNQISLNEMPRIDSMKKSDVLYTGVATEKDEKSSRPEHMTLNFKGKIPSKKQLGKDVTLKIKATGEYRNPETGVLENTGEEIDDEDFSKNNKDLLDLKGQNQKLHITTGVYNGGRAVNTGKAVFDKPADKTKTGKVAVFDNKGNWSYKIHECVHNISEELPMNNEIDVIKIEDYPENGEFYDVISQVKDIVYGFINKQTGERVDNRDFIHNHPNIRSIYHTNTDPCVTIKNKLGICMDQSLAIKYLFNQLHPDYLCKLYALTKGRFGHCVPCICTPQGKWYYIENAWDKERGIHGPIDSESAVKQYLTDVYDYRHSDVLDDIARVNDFNEGYLVESYTPLVENMSITPAQRKYSEYLIGHISNTKKGYFWIKENAPEMLTRCNKQNVENNLIVHDESKYSPEEYDAYSNYFYSKVRTPEIKKAFDLAWSHHWSHNKHHPEYWHGLPMPEDYIIEMICDWWSFSWKDGNLGEIFNFFNNVAVNDERKNMNPNTVKRVKELLDILHSKLVEKNLI